MQVLIVGDAAAAEFAEVMSTLRAIVPDEHIRFADEIADHCVANPADLVLVLQLWPDEYTREEMLSLIDQHPFARLIVCYGPWCVSDGRTRDFWPHAVRVPAAEGADRIRQEVDRLHAGRAPIPLTSTREETYKARLAADSAQRYLRLKISIVTPDSGLRDSLRAVLLASGHSISSETSPACDIVLWDADPWSDGGRERLGSLLSQCVGVPVVAMCGFPRSHETEELHQAGVAAVVSKLVSNEALLQRLDSLTRTVPDEVTRVTTLRVHEAG